MVQIEVQEDYNPIPTTTKAFARRSSTPLIKTICGDCVDPLPSSFCKWKQTLGRPILYQVIKCLDQSIYTPIEQRRREGEKPRAGNNQLRVDVWEKIITAKKTRFIWSGDVFLDPAVMGIKRAAAASPHGTSIGGHNGLEFIRNFNWIYLRPRQCSYIEAQMLQDIAQQQRHLRCQTAADRH